ncbi:hypothetical protein ASA1KI_37310 [Opitutales bacterium ASA1]|uniref:hypothetical protein n=1 Tax=Congregicoccus parvus TaxID=3081749 RepID=UPI002B308DF9|nr:hypothetical protein ASA1KI_37310 [Opitutales bacterium ASA1]
MNRVTFINRVLFVCAVALAVGIGGISATGSEAESRPLRVVGSDLLGDDFANALRASLAGVRSAASSEKQADALEMRLEGSLPAVRALSRGDADAALIFAGSGEERGGASLAGYERVPFAHLVVVALVAEDAPIRETSLPTLARIFGAGEATRVRRWSDLGVTDAAADRQIQPLVAGAADDIALAFFFERVLDGEQPGRHVERLDAPTRLAERLGRGRDGFGVARWSSTSTGSRARALALASADGRDAHAPTPISVATGDYPLAIALEVVFPAENAAAVRPLIAALSDPRASAALSAAGFLPVTRDASAERP